MRRSIVRRTRHWIANRGIGGTLAESFRRIPLLLRRLRPDSSDERRTARSRPAVHPFDARHGVDTSGLIWGENLTAPHPSSYWATGYYAISPSVFWQAMERLNLTWDRFTFIDIGAGKGRALMLAQRFPFRRVLGLELSPKLAQISRENLKRFDAWWNLANPFEVVSCDAVEFSWPPEPSVLFLYHPFAQPVMAKFLDHLLHSLREHPREVYLVYANPELHITLLKGGFLLKLWDDFFDVDAEDLTADFFGAHREHIAVYRTF